jgi:virulence factor Mce-like protein
MRRNQPRQITNFAAGAIVLTLVLIGTYLGFAKEIPFRHHYTISGVFTSSNNLRKNSPVRIAGVNVGKVVEVKKLGGDSAAAVVKMRIDKRGLPIHKDARLAIRPRIFLEGNFFVDIQPGSPSAAKIGDGDTVPINQTRAPVQLDQILTTLQAPTRKDLQDLLHSLSVGFSGAGGKGYNRSIPYWARAYKASAIVTDATLGEFQHDLSGYIATAGKTAAALDRNPEQLKSLVTDLDTSFGAFAARDTQLRAAIGELPNTLRAGIPALARLNSDFPALRAFIKDLRPGVRSSGPTLDAALPFVHQLRGLVRPGELRGLVHDLRPTVGSLARLNVKTTPLLEQVRAASSCQNETILPWTKDTLKDPTFPATGPVYVDSVKGLPGIAGESRAGDANGQWFRVLVSGGLYAYPATQGVMLTGNPIEGANPPAMARSPLKPDVPCETQQSPDLNSIPSTMPAAHKAAIPASKTGELLKLRDKAVKWMRSSVKADGLSKQLTVSSKPATQAIVNKLKAIRNGDLLRNMKRYGAKK